MVREGVTNKRKATFSVKKDSLLCIFCTADFYVCWYGKGVRSDEVGRSQKKRGEPPGLGQLGQALPCLADLLPWVSSA